MLVPQTRRNEPAGRLDPPPGPVRIPNPPNRVPSPAPKKPGREIRPQNLHPCMGSGYACAGKVSERHATRTRCANRIAAFELSGKSSRHGGNSGGGNIYESKQIPGRLG
jgi:hypothetical protein